MKKSAVLGLIAIIVGLSTTVVLGQRLSSPVYVPFVVLEHSIQSTSRITPTPTRLLPTPTPSPVSIPDGATTLRAVRERGVLNCGVNTRFIGFGFRDPDSDELSGFDIDFCKVMAAAVFGEGGAENVQMFGTTGTTRFIRLQSGDVDILIGNAAWTFRHDIESGLNFEFGPITFYDGQGLMVRADSGIESLEDLDGGSVCVRVGRMATIDKNNLSDAITTMGIDIEVQVYRDFAETITAYLDEMCDAFTTSKSGLVATHASIDERSAHIILNETISKDPLAPLVRGGDSNWVHIMRWSTICTIQAEESGVSQSNVDEMLNSDDSTVQHLLGTSHVNYGEMLGLNADFCYQIIKQVGNYADIYDRHLGTNSPIELPRGLNALWADGGVLYAPPFR